MSVFILKIVGLVIVATIAAFAGLIYMNVSKLEKEIETEIRGEQEK